MKPSQFCRKSVSPFKTTKFDWKLLSGDLCHGKKEEDEGGREGGGRMVGGRER